MRRCFFPSLLFSADVAELTADPSTFLACCPADEAFRNSGEFSFTEDGVFVEWYGSV